MQPLHGAGWHAVLATEQTKEDDARNKRDDDRDDGKLGAQPAVTAREQRDADGRRKRRQQDNPRQNVRGVHWVNSAAWSGLRRGTSVSCDTAPRSERGQPQLQPQRR